MDQFATNKLTNVDVCFLGYEPGKEGECCDVCVTAKEVEYCIASGFVQVTTADRVCITHISNVLIQKKV